MHDPPLPLWRLGGVDLLEQGRFRKAAKLLERARSHVNDARGPLLCRMKKMILRQSLHFSVKNSTAWAG